MERLLKTAAEGGNPADALKLCERLKIDWRRSTNEIVKKFVDAAVRQHVRDAPDQDKLLTFYKTEVRGCWRAARIVAQILDLGWRHGP